MSKVIYEGPSDTFRYGDTELKKGGESKMLPDNVVKKYTKMGHRFTEAASGSPVVVKTVDEGKK